MEEQVLFTRGVETGCVTRRRALRNRFNLLGASPFVKQGAEVKQRATRVKPRNGWMVGKAAAGILTEAEALYLLHRLVLRLHFQLCFYGRVVRNHTAFIPVLSAYIFSSILKAELMSVLG